MSNTSYTLLAAALLAGAAPAAAANLVPNGDFEAGTSGFTSGYTYVTPGPSALIPEAAYTVDFNAATSHPSFAAFGDHTSGEGRFMIVNGSGVADVPVWTSAAIAVTAGTLYDFSAFLSSVYPDSPASLSFSVSIDGGPAQSLGTFGAPGTVGVWTGIGSSFLATGSSAVLSIINENTAFTGNDFGLDDISLDIAAVPEPTTWALLLAGFGMVGIAARRRRVGVVVA